MAIRTGERIRRIRATKGLTQANVAEELGLTESAYSKIERGESDPNTTRLYRIAEILEVDVREFFDTRPVKVAMDEPAYGYATRDELESLRQQMHRLLKEMEKLKLQIGTLAVQKKRQRKKIS
ncbi:MAG TPA: helix-turn-helix transcriptional regulator [Bacteroidia bacterium]|nr:helix-turn-helix transcriptional regulator [Bacteroidia bacterium]